MPDPRVILLVDDDVDFVEINRRVLESAGYRVVCCYSRQDALSVLAGQPIDLVVTDLMMSELDSGFSLASAVKQDPSRAGVPVIVATSVSRQTGFDFRPRSADDLARMHVDAFLDKPVRPATLLDKIAELLKTRSP